MILYRNIGKTVALFSFIASYQLANSHVGKMIYCTRTIPEMEKSLKELQQVLLYCDSEISKDIQDGIKREYNTESKTKGN